jgi:hypothetical protein
VVVAVVEELDKTEVLVAEEELEHLDHQMVV